MANAGTVTVDFAAEVAKFNAALKQVNDRVKNVESGFRSLEKVATTALKFFSVGIAARFLQSAAEAADALGKTADKLGISTERLAAFQLAAADAGVETETLNKLLTDAQRRLGDASFGSGDTFKALRQFGFTVRELQALSPDELFLKYADAIGTLKNRSDQFSAAQALFGKTAQQAFTIIEAGRPAIEEAAETVNRLGLALSRVDILKIEEANDKLALLAKTSTAFGQQLAVAIAPFASAFVDAVTHAGVGADDARSSIEVFVRTVVIGFGVVANAAHVFDAAVSAAFAAVTKGSELAFAALRSGFELTATLDEAVGLDALAAKFRGFAQAVGDAELFASSLSEAAAERAKAGLDSIKSFEQLNAQIDEILASAQAKAEAAAAARQEANAGLGQTEDPRIGAFSATNAALEELQTQHFDRMLEIQLDFANRSAELSERLDVEEFVRHQEFRQEAFLKSEQAIFSARQQFNDAAIGLLQALAGKSKAAAIALVLINKAKAIAQAIQNTEVAATAALAYGDPYTAAARVAVIRGLGYASVALIAATGFSEIQSINRSGGGGASLGSPQNPVFTSSSGTSNGSAAQPGATQKPVANITIVGWGERTLRELATELSKVMGDYDLRIQRQN